MVEEESCAAVSAGSGGLKNKVSIMTPAARSREGVTALFVENMSDPRLIEQIGKETGVKIGGEIYADALSEKGQGGSTYLEMFKHNIALLAPAMSGS